MNELIQGYKKFREEVYPTKQDLFQRLANKQKPGALFITCADSRIVPDLMLQCSPGDLFICRNAGNIVPPYGELLGGVSATIEYAVMALDVRNIIVCGHSDCGAMNGLLHPEKTEGMATVRTWLRNSEAALRTVQQGYPDLTGEARLHALVEENVITQLDHLRTHPSVAAALARGEMNLYGWVYHIPTGEIVSYDRQRGRFVPLDGSLASATPERRMRAVPAALR